MGNAKPARVYIADTEASERMGLAARLERAPGFEVRSGERLVADAATVEAGVGDAEILCVTLGQVGAAAIERAADLRLILKCGSGVNNIDVAAARRRGIPVLHTRGANFTSVAEYVIGALIALNRRMVDFDRAVRRGEWEEERERWAGRLPALTDKVLGIVGVGSIGAELARLAHAHGMEVIGFDPRVDPEVARAQGVVLTSKQELFERADVVSLHLLLDASTVGFVGAADLARMKSTAVLVNTARGPVVDEAALVSALEAGEIAGAVLDVFEQEPLSADSGLVGFENCLLSPHLAGCTDHGYAEIGVVAMDLLERFRAGRPAPTGAIVAAGGELRIESS